MNYVIINGVDSRSIPGLLISTLPAISKPLIRTEIEEIDGRDGDIVNKLGYAARDVEMTIGLHGNFDINEVISFFNSEGNIIFSTEPTKYYKFAIYNQIDFEKLIRFRTAAVTLHIQPFKYDANEATLNIDTTESDSVTVSNTGNIYSKPTVTLTGSGIINLSLNNNQLFSVDLKDAFITIDVEALEAYANGVLKNRKLTGDIDNLRLLPGENTLTWSGELTELTIFKYTRWI